MPVLADRPAISNRGIVMLSCLQCRWLAGALLAGWLAAGSAPAADIYVASNATPAEPYTNWSGAFTNLQNALDYARTNEGEAVSNIYLAGHIFQGTGVANSVFAWQDATNQTLRGGYEADPEAAELPGARDSAQWPTILQRSAGTARVLLLSNLEDCVFEQVTIRNGSGATNGSGVCVSGCRGIAWSSPKNGVNLKRLLQVVERVHIQ